MNIGFISLGCSKNQVDSEEILMYLKRNGCEITTDPDLADVIIINTCAFIEAAKKEAIEVILDMASYKKPLVVVGCMAQRYAEELKKEIPEISLIIPIKDYNRFGELFKELTKMDLVGKIDPTKRLYISKSKEAYLRISEGCNRMCTYCAIPLIRGRFTSVPLETLKEELKEMDKAGIKSINIISQDTTNYGKDIGLTIVDLLKEVVKYPNFEFIKLMYLYPSEVSDELINFFKEHPNMTPYFDLPLQHSSNSVLKRMNRRGTREDYLELIDKFRKEVPNAILRTTMMVGFPGETDEDFQDLLDFVKSCEFDHLGAFTYSKEEGTAAFRFDNEVDPKVAKQRYKELMKLQNRITYRNNKKRIGQEIKFLVQEYDEEDLCYFGISDLFAPDDIDGKLFVYSKRPLQVGEIVKCKIVNTRSAYDLEGEVIN